MGEMLKYSDHVFAEMIATKYPGFGVPLKIRDYIEEQYNQRIFINEELVYLAVQDVFLQIEDEN